MSAMNGTHFSSTASKEEDKFSKEDNMVKFGERKDIARRSDSPVIRAKIVSSGPEPRAEHVRQPRGASPNQGESRTGRRGSIEFDQDVRRSQHRALPSSDYQHDVGYSEDYRSNSGARNNRGRSTDRYMRDERHTRYSRSQERYQPDDINGDMNYQPRYGTDFSNSRMNVHRRPSSLGRYNERFPSMVRYGADNYGYLRPKRDYYGRNADYARQQLRKDFAFDEHRRLYRDQSNRQRSQSLGRFEFDGMNGRHFGNKNAVESQHRRNQYRMQPPIGRFSEPSVVRKNRYFEVLRYGDSDRSIFAPDFNVSRRYVQYECDDFDRFGVDEFGFVMDGNYVVDF